jgi:hypothetical protein
MVLCTIPCLADPPELSADGDHLTLFQASFRFTCLTLYLNQIFSVSLRFRSFRLLAALLSIVVPQMAHFAHS